MKYLLITLLLTSCSISKFRKPIELNKKPVKETKPCLQCKTIDFTGRMERCMLRFSKQGFDSQAVINICESVFKRRN